VARVGLRERETNAERCIALRDAARVMGASAGGGGDGVLVAGARGGWITTTGPTKR